MNRESPRLVVEPDDCLIDQFVSMRLERVPANTVFVFESETSDAMGRRWKANLESHSDDGGTARPGSPNSIDSMELFWGARVDDGSVGVPFSWPGSDPLTTRLRCLTTDGREIGTAKVLRRFRSAEIKREVVGEGLFSGVFFSPENSGRSPTFMFVGGSDGGIHEHQAALLASHGFATLSLAYFAYPGLQPELADVPLEYFIAALDWLESRPEVDSARMGIVGHSRGGELALLLASIDQRLRMVIGYVGSGAVYSGVTKDRSYVRAAWTYGSEPLTHLVPIYSLSDQESPAKLTPAYLDSLDNATAVRNAEIAVENVSGDIILFSGDDDQLWPSAALSSIAVRRLARVGGRHPIYHVVYPKAGHAFRVPFMPTTLRTILHPITGREYALGGTPRGNAVAALDAWRLVRRFISRKFEEPKNGD